MASLPDPPKYRNGKRMTHWIEPEPSGVLDWALCVVLLLMALPVLATFGPVVLLVRVCGRVAGKAGASC